MGTGVVKISDGLERRLVVVQGFPIRAIHVDRVLPVVQLTLLVFEEGTDQETVVLALVYVVFLDVLLKLLRIDYFSEDLEVALA